ncbi:MAG TPA: 30S ribosomal protein S7 [Candidatus Parcubacteria bacterium]|jgi:small subunit ribosomal protein S7|nr:30S ribosomal protein S7 [Parcubacteria group bacterium]HJN61980.1 30S ribosomal protein S7 [Candidatus Parcubacteria bacterium]|tara:strand:- start:84404 stop:84871 length:468 start_codon:yes stop_codon:yes gene_type:complete
MDQKKRQQDNIQPDLIYNSTLVSKFINQLMKKGKKTIVRKILYGAFDIIKEKTKKEPLEVFELAIENVSPLLEVKSKRVGGATYQVPTPVNSKRKISLAIRWLIDASKTKKGKPMKVKLADELIDASKNTGGAVRKKENTHRMAEANRAFAHFSW